MQALDGLTPDQRFFFETAGFSYDPKTETPEQGRTRCAIQLADAEATYLQAHKVSTVECEWHDDEECDTCERAAITVHDERSGKRIPLSALGGIVDADDNCRRVARAELALECRDDLLAIIDGSGE